MKNLILGPPQHGHPHGHPNAGGMNQPPQNIQHGKYFGCFLHFDQFNLSNQLKHLHQFN